MCVSEHSAWAVSIVSCAAFRHSLHGRRGVRGTRSDLRQGLPAQHPCSRLLLDEAIEVLPHGVRECTDRRGRRCGPTCPGGRASGSVGPSVRHGRVGLAESLLSSTIHQSRAWGSCRGAINRTMGCRGAQAPRRAEGRAALRCGDASQAAAALLAVAKQPAGCVAAAGCLARWCRKASADRAGGCRAAALAGGRDRLGPATGARGSHGLVAPSNDGDDWRWIQSRPRINRSLAAQLMPLAPPVPQRILGRLRSRGTPVSPTCCLNQCTPSRRS
jgi:hypothetical protein